MDKASYHFVHVDTTIQKVMKQKWLQEKEVQFLPLETLRKRVKQLIPREKIYELDEIALSMGHQVVRLLLYHCQ